MFDYYTVENGLFYLTKSLYLSILNYLTEHHHGVYPWHVSL